MRKIDNKDPGILRKICSYIALVMVLLAFMTMQLFYQQKASANIDVPGLNGSGTLECEGTLKKGVISQIPNSNLINMAFDPNINVSGVQLSEGPPDGLGLYDKRATDPAFLAINENTRELGMLLYVEFNPVDSTNAKDLCFNSVFLVGDPRPGQEGKFVGFYTTTRSDVTRTNDYIYGDFFKDDSYGVIDIKGAARVTTVLTNAPNDSLFNDLLITPPSTPPQTGQPGAQARCYYPATTTQHTCPSPGSTQNSGGASVTVNYQGGGSAQPNKCYISSQPESAGGVRTYTEITCPGNGGGNVGAGPCSEFTNRIEFENCNKPVLQDFKTIKYKNETYILDEWSGKQDGKMKWLLRQSPYSDRSRGINSCFAQDKFRLPQFYIDVNADPATASNGQYDLNIDGDGGDSQVNEFIESMNEIGDRMVFAKFIDSNLSTCVLDEDNAVSKIVVENGRNISNMLILARSSETNKLMIGFLDIAGGRNEKKIAELAFEEPSTSPKTTFRATEALRGCSDRNSFSKVVLGQDATSLTNGRIVPATLTIESNSPCDDAGTRRVLNVLVTVNFDVTFEEGTSAGVQAAAAAAAAEEARTTCQKQAGIIGWVICAVLNLIDSSVNFFYDNAIKLLFTDMNQFDQDRGIYTSWNIFRQLATIIIVIVALIMVLSQAFGEGLLDNYSVKKILPRLILSGIAIQLSWIIMTQLVNIANVIGNGIGGIILSPFGVGIDDRLSVLVGSALGSTSGGQDAILTAAVIIGGIALVFFALPIGIAVISALFVGVITLIVRNMIILLGVIFAPLGLAFGVLPATQKISKMWWDNFFKALMMYPIVIALIAAGKLTATLLLEAGQVDTGVALTEGDQSQVSLFFILAAILAWFAPFVLLPKAFQWGGAAIAGVAGAAGKVNGKVWGDKAKSWNEKRVGAKKQWKDKVKTNDLAMKAGQGNKRAATKLRMKQGQPVTGKMFAYGAKRQAIDKARIAMVENVKEERVKEAEQELTSGNDDISMAFQNPNAEYAPGKKNMEKIVAEIQNTNDGARRQALINKVITMKDDGAMRQIVQAAAAPGAKHKEELQRAYTNGSVAGAFLEKAPDLVGANPQNGKLGDIGLKAAPQTHLFSDETWRNAHTDTSAASHYENILRTNADAAAYIDDKKLKAINESRVKLGLAELDRDKDLAKPPKAP